MRVRHFNIAGVAWSNFKPGINTNGRTAISNNVLSVDTVKVGGGVNVAVVTLGVEGRGRLRLQAAGLRSPRVCRARRNVQRWQQRQRQRQPFEKRVTHCAAAITGGADEHVH